MKLSSKTTAGNNGNNRISALKRLSKPTTNNTNVHHRLSAPTSSAITDARQLLTNRNKSVFDARQLLSRQSSKTSSSSLPIRQNIVQDEEEDEDEDDDAELSTIGKQKSLFITRSNDGRLTSGLLNRPSFVTARNSQLTEPISFTKTIKNTTISLENNNRSSQNTNSQLNLSDQKVVISFLNDQYRKRPKSPTPPPPPPPPVIRRLHSTSMQTTQTSSATRSPIRTNSARKYSDEQYEPPTKRTASRNTIADIEQSLPTTSSKGSLKRTSTDAFGSTQPKVTTSTRSNSDETTILITNLRSSVTEDDIIELFSEVGDINDIKTLSRGCVQIIYAKHEQAEDAVARYHNRLLDGQLMYVSLQQPTSYTTKSSKNASSQHSKAMTTKNNVSSSSSSSKNEPSESSSSKFAIDPAFIRQALFNPSNTTTNAVQFQVKL